MIQEKENELIKKLQTGKDYDNPSVFSRFLWLCCKLTDNYVTMLVGMVLFLAADSLIAFKTTLLYCFGLFLITVLKMFYLSPRPFWVDPQIKVLFESSCNFDYGSPTTHLFNLLFFYGYSIFMYFLKYSENINWPLVYVLYSVLTIVSFFVMYA